MSTPHRYTAELADQIERKWQARWEERGAYEQPNPGDPNFDGSRPKYYVLDMFPYPSGAGLHVGHPEGYIATDIVARYKRMRGHNVLHPMGWDAFGLPAEQYAIRTGIHPARTTREAIDNFRRQLKRFGFSYDWSREFGTIDEDYYRWTQWIFVQIYDAWFDPVANKARPIAELEAAAAAGEVETPRPWAEMDAAARRAFLDDHRLAYVDEQTVNWCPKLGTALANEEVIDGRSERGAYPVVRKPLKQWLFRITAYAERLLEGLADVDWPESTRVQQTEWIGRSEGAEIDFALADGSDTLRVYTTRPDTIFGATYMVVAPEHPLLERASPEAQAYAEAARKKSDLERVESREKTGVDTGLFAVNPATGATIPVWVADYVLMGYGHGAIMAVPAGDERDFEFATKFELPIVRVVVPPDRSEPDGCYAGEGIAVNSASDEVSLNGLDTAAAKERVIAWLEAKGIGRHKVNTRLRDWLFSRQRYWGEPFPIVWDENGDHHPVRADRLPVALPDMEDFAPEESEDPQPMLAKATEWVATTAGEAGVDGLPADAPVQRETNTMPGWAGSCWYYLRYCDPGNSDRFVGEEAERYWMGERGVDLYIGGNEHAVLHLLYARFWHMVLHDLGHVSTPEPFKKLFHQGMITSFAYQRPDKSLVAVDQVEERDGAFFEKADGQPVTQAIAKMSKSLKNVINPDEIVADYGADTFRLYEMYMGALADSKPWNTKDTNGMFRFLRRAWRVAVDERTGEARTGPAKPSPDVERLLHKAIAKVGADIEKLHLNTAIAAMIEVVNAAGKDGLTHDQMDRFFRILAPFAPHLAEEVWHRLGREGSITRAPWPEHDPSLLVEDTIEVPVQVRGKVRARIQVPRDIDDAALEAEARAAVADHLDGKTVRKVVIVPRRLVNLVV